MALEKPLEIQVLLFRSFQTPWAINSTQLTWMFTWGEATRDYKQPVIICSDIWNFKFYKKTILAEVYLSLQGSWLTLNNSAYKVISALGSKDHFRKATYASSTNFLEVGEPTSGNEQSSVSAEVTARWLSFISGERDWEDMAGAQTWAGRPFP